ncbi:unnamed protein product [Larinioides sclopetarius]|uniref:C2H2-type domain-containing protein n=1 Tax=Larinioides sclopetarius TaxID=280406 RepID=A0AAV2BLP3_9ARAC
MSEFDEVVDKPDLCTNDSVVDINQEYGRYRQFAHRNSQLTENIMNISSIDYSNDNASINSIFDTRLTPLQQENSHVIWHSSCIQCASKTVPNDKEKEMGNYSTTLRTSKSENGDIESDIIKSDFRDFIELISSSLHEQNDVQSSVISNSSEEYRAPSYISNRDAVFNYCICTPESFETSEKGIFLYHTNFPTSTGDSGNCETSLGLRDDNMGDILRNYVESQNHIIQANQTSNEQSKLYNSEGFLVSVNNINVNDASSSTTSMFHGDLDDRLFICKECGRGFRQKINLVSHYRIHTGVKPFACDKCDKKFRHPSNLTNHLRTHTGEKPFACDKCEKRFSERGNLDKHRRTHTREKPFACDKCEKKFKQSNNLKEHLRTHTGEKPLACDKCLKRFSQRSNLYSHRRNHT